MITINGKQVTEIRSIQKFYDYSTSPPKVTAVYIEGQWEDGSVFYFKSDQDNGSLVIDGQLIGL